MTDIVITQMVVPPRADAPDAQEFCAMVDHGNRMARLDAGIDDLDETAEQLLPSWIDQTDYTRRGFIARSAGEIVGAGHITTANQPGTESADLELMVVPPHWAGGVGPLLLERLEQEAQALERSTLQSWSLHPAAPGVRTLTPATGCGEVASTPLTDLLAARGYALEQVERNSVLSLAASSALAEHKLVEATAFAGPDYRIVTWTLPTPAHLRGGYGGMIARMATDVPSGDLDFAEEVWDDERVVRRDAQLTAGGQMMAVAAVIHEPSGEMVAFNELVIGADRAGVTHQWGTLVVKEHRGRRLGTIVKCANLLRWRELAPESTKVSTFNAEENRPMLDINEAVGFTPASYAGGWQKRLG